MTVSDYIRLAGGVGILLILAAAALTVYALRRGVRNLELDTRQLPPLPLPPVSEWDQQARPAPRPAASGRVRIDPASEPFRCASTLDHPAHLQGRRMCAGRRTGPRRFRV